MKKVQIIEIKSEIGAGTRGASLGTQAIKVASLNANSDFFRRYPTVSVKDENQLLFQDTAFQYAKNIDGLHTVFSRLSSTLQDVFQQGDFPVVLAGDHSSAAGTITGIKAAHPDKRLGVIWVDAHADLHSPYTTPSGNVHGMPLAIALADNNLDQQINDVPTATEKYWNELRSISGVCPMIQHEDLVFIGVRDTEFPEDYMIEKNNIKNISVTDARTKGIKQTAADTLSYLDKCDIIYISFDVDSMDCHYVSHGTGTPVPVGFSEYEATQLMCELLKSDKICCYEITEVNPTLDEKCNKMAETAFRILEKTVEVKFN